MNRKGQLSMGGIIVLFIGIVFGLAYLVRLGIQLV